MTQQDNESRKWLYDKFVNSGLNVGKDYAEFSALMDSNEESRQWAFDKARSMGLNVGADYNQFSSLISPVQQEEQEQTQEPVTEQPVKPIENTVQNVAEPTIQTGIKPLQGHEVSRIEDAPGYVEPKSDELQAKEQNRQQVMSLSEEIDNAILEQQNRNVEQFKKEQSESPLAMALAYMAPNATPHLHNRIYQGHSGQEIEYRTLQSAQRSLRDAQRMIDEADHNAQQGTFGKWLESSFAGGAARGLGQKLFDADTWDMGVSDMDDASSLMTALNTFDSGKPLTKNQQLLLDAKAVELATNAYFGSEVGRGYKAGAVTAESIPFMIEMCINPASATGEGATSMLTRYALKRFGKNAVKNNAKKYLAAKATAQVVGDLAGSAAMAATTGAGRVIGGTAERMNGDIQIDNDENGNTIFAGHGDGEDFGSAFYKSFASTTIENYSEMFGEYFEPVLSPIGGAMSRIATSKGGKKIGLNYVKDFIDNVAASDVAKIVTDFEKHAKWNGMFGEYAEEVAGGIMNALVVGDQTLDTDEDTGVFNLDQNIDTFLGVSLMGGFMSGVKTLGYRTPKYKARKAMEKADNTASLKFNSPEDWQFIRESIVSGTDEDTEVMLYNVLKNDDFSAEQKMAVLDFTRRYEEYCGVVQGEDSERGEKVQKIADEQATEEEEQQLAVSRAYDHGHEAPTEERRDIIFDAQFNPDNAEAQQSYQGMLDRINEDADQWRDSQIELAQFMSSTDETLRPAQLKAVDEEGKDQFVFIREGKVSLTEDGTMIDVANSDKTIVVYNQKTGKREMISPKDLLSLGNEESLDAAIDDIAQRRDHMVQQEINQANGILSFIPGDVVSIKTEDGQLAQGTLISTDGTNSVIQLEDGSQVGASNAELQQLADDLALADYKQRKGIADEAPTEQPAAEQLNEKPNGAPAEYTNDMELVVRDEDGQDKRAIVQGRVRYDAQTLSFIPDENGAMIEYYVEGEGMKHDYPDRLNDKVVSYTSVEKPATEPQGTVAEPEAGVTEADNTSVEEKPVVNNEVEDTPNSYVGRSLSEKEADDIVSKMEAAADAAPDIPLNETTWNEQFPNGEVETPIGMAKFGENQLAKLFLKGREKEFGMLKPTLTNPDVIIEEESQAIDGNAERNSSYLFVKTFNYGGEKVKFYTSVTVKKDGMEVVISNHITGRNAINKKMQNGKILHLNENYAPSSSDLHLAENQNGLPDLLPTQEAKPLLDATLSSPDINEGSRSVAPNSGISGGKVTENSATIQEKAEENVGNMPMTEDGEPDYMSVTPERAHSFIYNEAGLSRDEANEHVKANLDKAQDDFQKAKNAATPKMGTSIKKFNEQKEKRQQKIDDAQRRVDYWAKVSKQQSDIIAAKRAEQQAKDAAAHDAAVEANLAEREEQKRKDAERQAVGNQNVMPEIRDKWEKATKIDGEDDEIMLPNGTSVSGHYVLHESGAATASHQATAGFAPTDGYPLDENGNNANPRDYEHNKNDQDYTRQIAGSYNQMALDKPVVVSRDGVVLSGNGRTMAGELAAQDGTDQAYIDYLKKYGYKKYGFSPEQIAAMEHPRVAFVPDADMPYNSETFDMFNKSDMKENSKTEESVKLGKTVSDDVYQKLIRLVGESGSTLGEFYNNDQATSEAVSLLVSSGIIGSNEAPKYASEGKLSEVGRDLIENILVGKAFSNNPDAVRMLTAVPSLRKSAVSALSEITTNMGMNEDFNLQQPLSDAINLAYKARTEGGYGFGDPVSGYARQLNLFAFEDEMQTEADVNNATTLLLADLLNSGRESDLKKFMRSYNEQSKESADGQIDMWTGDVKHRDEIIKELFDQLKYKQNNDRKQKPTAVEPRAKQRKGVEQTGESMPSVQDDTTVEQQNNNPAENIPDSGNKDVENIPNDEDPWGIADRIEEQEDDWEEDGNLNTVYKRTVLIDGKHKVTKIDAPYDNKNNYQTSYEYDGKSFADLKQVVDYIDKPSVQQTVASAEAEVNTEPTEAQKKAGNYKKGHAKVAGFDITIENPKGSQRSGVDENGNAWSNTMNNTYGYIRGTEGVDGDHIDVFLADDMGTWDGKTVFIVDQKKRSGKTFSKLEGIDGNEIDLGYEEPVMVFDEHKVMLGFNDIESARKAYLSNYEDGWQGLGAITPVSKEEFKKWIDSSHRKTKPFAEYSSVKPLGDTQLGEQPNKPTVKAGEDYVSAAERIAKEHEVKRTAAHFAEETQEEATAFDKLVPEMDDAELLAYMQEDGMGDVNKAHHPSVYDEYDYRHGDEQLQSYDATLVRLNESGTTLEQAEEMLANLQKDVSRFATDERAELLGQEEALQEYIAVQENRKEEMDEVTAVPQQTEQASEENAAASEYTTEKGNKLSVLRSKYPDRVFGEQHEDGSVTFHDEDALLVSQLIGREFDGEDLTLAKEEADKALQKLIANGHKVAFYGTDYKPKYDEHGNRIESNPQKVAKKPAASKKASSEQTGKIDDVGERLEGARKDMCSKIAESLANVTEAALIEKPFGKVYKKPDLKKAVESGALREKDAVFYEALFSMVNQQKPKVTQSEMRSKRYIPDFKTKAERWAADTFKQMEVLRQFMELDEPGRDAMMERMLADRYPTREQELAEIEKRKGWNPDYEGHKYEWGDMTTPNPLWVTHEVMNRLGYSVGDKLDVPYGVVKANTSGTGYSIENLKGERASLFGSGMTLDEAIDRIVYLAKLKRGDADVSHPTQLFAFPATKSESGESGRYRVMWGRDYKTREFDSKDEADAFAQTKNGAYVSPIMETKRKFGYKVRFTHPLTGEKMFVDDTEFDTKEEAQAYFDGNFEKLNEATNAKLQEEREKKGEKKTLTADDVVHVTMVHSAKGGWTHAVVIDKKYANNDGQVRIIKEGFASRKDAKSFADSVKDDVLKTVLKHKEDAKKIVYFDTGENSRIGEDYRNGKDVDAEDFMNTFGFRGVQFGNWTNQADRQMAVNQAYDAFMDMARLIGVSPKAMSLNGELGIAFGARGVGGFAAHYEPDEVVINLTKTQGAGSLAHEWWHALDNYFARRAGSASDMVTDNRRIEMRDALRKAFNDMLDLVNGSDYAQRSAAKGEYWGRTHEITARLLAEWVDRELKKRGELNTFLSRGAVVERGQQHNYDVYEVLERLAGREPMPFEEYKELPESLKGIPYPSAKEVEQFGGSLCHIFDTLEEKVDEETGNVMLYEPTATYETRDGGKVVCRSLFDEMGVRSSDEVAMVSQHTQQGQGQNQVIAPSEIRLRKLKKGETCHVERVYEETKQFDFTGKEKVESAEDVAYIFRQLENAAVENSFLVLVKDGRPTVIHLGVGSYVNVMAPYEQALVAYRELKPEQVYFVHNHPSGVLKASRQDQELLKRVKMAFGEDVVQQGIIIDTTSGKYGEFDMVADNYDLVQTSGVEAMPQSEGADVPVKVYQFSRQVFAPDWNPESAFKIVSSQSVAEFVSSHRLGKHKKMSFLVVNNSGNVVANVFLPWTKLSDIKRSKDAGDLLAGYVHQCGGVRGVLYGNYDYEADDRAVLAAVGGRMRQLNAPLMDALHVEHSAYENGWDGVGEPKEGYGVDATPFHNIIDEMFGNEDFDKSAHARERYDLGATPEWMKGIGISGERFTLSFKNIKTHLGKDADHNLTAKEWHELPSALKHPFLVTSYGNKDGKFRLYTTIKVGDKFAVVGVDVVRINQGKGVPMLELNRIKTVFGRDRYIVENGERILAWDKNITPEQEALLRGHNYREYPTIQELSAANIYKNFELISQLR